MVDQEGVVNPDVRPKVTAGGELGAVVEHARGVRGIIVGVSLREGEEGTDGDGGPVGIGGKLDRFRCLRGMDVDAPATEIHGGAGRAIAEDDELKPIPAIASPRERVASTACHQVVTTKTRAT